MNSSTALARVLAAALPELGVRHVLLCPGSRSAPLAYALGAAEQAGLIRLYVRLDERSAGFVALGLAKASGQPVAIVTTSGTAVANLHPAVLEASHSGVPLLVISADRPHELRGTGANQTTDQTRLFGTATRYFAEIPAGPWPGAGSASATAGGWRNVLARTVAAATGALSGDPGPVQLNVAFHEPLTPGPDEPMDAWPAELTAVDGLTRVLAATTAGAVTLGAGPRTVVLAADGAGPAAARVAAAAGWPLLAEPSAGTGAAGIPAYRLLLAEPRLGGQIERVIVFGRPTLSRPVTRLLAREDVEVIVVSPRPVWTDAARRASMVLPALGPQDVRATSPDDDAWPTLWRSAGAAAAQVIDDLLEDEAAAGRLTGPLVAREVLAVTAVSDVLVVGSSNPIRDLDLIGGSGRPVLANRGLAGIDGIISTAAGVALACAGPGTVRALVGDLTFLHDAGGLAVGTLEQAPDLQIVVPDDSGGSIFETLEQGEQAAGDPGRRARFERLFATPQRTDLAAICAGYRVRHTLVKDLDGLRAALADPPAGLSVVQVPIERTSRRELAGRLAAVVEATIRDVRNPAR